MSTVYARMYLHLEDLLPGLAHHPEGASFYALPRIKGDWSLYSSITKKTTEVTEIEIAHDQLVHGSESAAPWMIFSVNHLSRTAELLTFQDERSYEVMRPAGAHSTKRSNLNIFAVNWLHVLADMAFVFKPLSVDEVALSEKAE